MDMPNYDGLIEQWKVDLIILRAKLLGFRSHDIPDALQDVVWVVLDFEYDPHHVNGAAERTVLTTVIDNHLRKIKRSATRYRTHVERSREPLELGHDKIDLRAMDVADAVAKLTEREQTVCQGLAYGLSKTRIAKELGCGYHTVDRIVARLRKHFRQIGLAGWIGE